MLLGLGGDHPTGPKRLSIIERHTSDDPDADVVRCGFLLMQRSNASWKPRWVLLRRDYIIIFTSQPRYAPDEAAFGQRSRSARPPNSTSPVRHDSSLVASANPLLAILTLKGARLAIMSDSSPRPFFTIVEGGRTTAFSAVEMSVLLDWANAIRALLEAQVLVRRAPSMSSNDVNGSVGSARGRLRNGSSTEMEHGQCEISFAELELNLKVGDGHFGEVFCGSLWGTEVAIKQLKKQHIDDDVLTALKNEVAILSQLRHPNIVLYIGACTAPPNVCIVTEWCAGGSLYNLLHDRKIPLNFSQMVDMCTGIAQGVNYLHSLARQIIHRDLKSHNVLVNASLTPKVCDFGLSHVRQSFQKSTKSGDLSRVIGGGHYGVFGTPEWMAPEMIEGLPYNASVDIYSFGIMMTEFLSRQMPFSDRYLITGYRDIIAIVLDEGAIPSIPDWAGQLLTTLIEQCLDRTPSNRPSFMDVISELRRLQADKASFFLSYDVPRMLAMLLSTEDSNAALAGLELSTLSAHDVARIDSGTINVLVARLSVLMGPKPQQVVYARALLCLIDDRSDIERALFRTMLLEGGGLATLFNMVSQISDTTSIGTAILSILLHDVPVPIQARYMDMELPPEGDIRRNGLFLFKQMVHANVTSLETEKEKIELEIAHQRSLLQRITVSCTVMRCEWAKLAKIRMEPRVALRQRLSAARYVEGDLLSALIPSFRDSNAFNIDPDIPETAPVALSFIIHFGNFLPSLFDNALRFNRDTELWGDIFLFMFGGDIRVYDVFDANDPEDCILILPTLRAGSGEPISVTAPRELVGRAHAITISDSFTLAFKTRVKALRWAHRINPIVHDPAPAEHVVEAQKRKRQQLLKKLRRRVVMQSLSELPSQQDLGPIDDVEADQDVVVAPSSQRDRPGPAGEYLRMIDVDEMITRDLAAPPPLFLEYFGTFISSKGGFALRWIDKHLAEAGSSLSNSRVAFQCTIVAEGGHWIPTFLWAHGHVLRIYESSNDQPDEPLSCVYLTTVEGLDDRPVRVTLGARHSRPHCMDIENDKGQFAFRSRAIAESWAHHIVKPD